MSDKECKYNMTELGMDIRYLKDKVQRIDICLNGDDSNPESLGLVHLVSNNTKFRQKITKILTATWAAISAISVKFIYDTVKKLSGG